MPLQWVKEGEAPAEPDASRKKKAEAPRFAWVKSGIQLDAVSPTPLTDEAADAAGDTDWIGPRTQFPIDQVPGGREYQELLAKNRKYRTRGFWEALTDVTSSDTPFVGGFLEAGKLANVASTARKIQRGETPTDEDLVAFNQYLQYSRRKETAPWTGKAGEIVRNSFFFGLEIVGSLALAGAPGAAVATGKAAAKEAGEEVTESLLSKMAKTGIGKWMGKVAELPGKGSWQAAAAERLTKKFVAAGGGKVSEGVAKAAAWSTVHLHDIGIKGAWLTALNWGRVSASKEQMNLQDAFEGKPEASDPQLWAMAALDTWIENATEMSGYYLGAATAAGLKKVPLFAKVAADFEAASKEEITRGFIYNFFAGQSKSTDVSLFRHYLKQAGFAGVLNEMGEERYAGFLHGLTGTNPDDKAGLLQAVKMAFPQSLDDLKAEMLAFSLPSAAGAASDMARTAKLAGGVGMRQAIENRLDASMGWTEEESIRRSGEAKSAAKRAAAAYQAEQEHPSIFQRLFPKMKWRPGSIAGMLRDHLIHGAETVYREAEQTSPGSGEQALADYLEARFKARTVEVETEAEQKKLRELAAEGKIGRRSVQSLGDLKRGEDLAYDFVAKPGVLTEEEAKAAGIHRAVPLTDLLAELREKREGAAELTWGKTSFQPRKSPLGQERFRMFRAQFPKLNQWQAGELYDLLEKLHRTSNPRGIRWGLIPMLWAEGSSEEWAALGHPEVGDPQARTIGRFNGLYFGNRAFISPSSPLFALAEETLHAGAFAYLGGQELDEDGRRLNNVIQQRILAALDAAKKQNDPDSIRRLEELAAMNDTPGNRFERLTQVFNFYGLGQRTEWTRLPHLTFTPAEVAQMDAWWSNAVGADVVRALAQSAQAVERLTRETPPGEARPAPEPQAPAPTPPPAPAATPPPGDRAATPVLTEDEIISRIRERLGIREQTPQQRELDRIQRINDLKRTLGASVSSFEIDPNMAPLTYRGFTWWGTKWFHEEPNGTRARLYVRKGDDGWSLVGGYLSRPYPLADYQGNEPPAAAVIEAAYKEGYLTEEPFEVKPSRKFNLQELIDQHPVEEPKSSKSPHPMTLEERWRLAAREWSQEHPFVHRRRVGPAGAEEEDLKSDVFISDMIEQRNWPLQPEERPAQGEMVPRVGIPWEDYLDAAPDWFRETGFRVDFHGQELITDNARLEQLNEQGEAIQSYSLDEAWARGFLDYAHPVSGNLIFGSDQAVNLLLANLIGQWDTQRGFFRALRIRKTKDAKRDWQTLRAAMVRELNESVRRVNEKARPVDRPGSEKGMARRRVERGDVQRIATTGEPLEDVSPGAVAEEGVLEETPAPEALNVPWEPGQRAERSMHEEAVLATMKLRARPAPKEEPFSAIDRQKIPQKTDYFVEPREYEVNNPWLVPLRIGTRVDAAGNQIRYVDRNTRGRAETTEPLREVISGVQIIGDSGTTDAEGKRTSWGLALVAARRIANENRIDTTGSFQTPEAVERIHNNTMDALYDKQVLPVLPGLDALIVISGDRRWNAVLGDFESGLVNAMETGTFRMARIFSYYDVVRNLQSEGGSNASGNVRVMRVYPEAHLSTAEYAAMFRGFLAASKIKGKDKIRLGIASIANTAMQESGPGAPAMDAHAQIQYANIVNGLADAVNQPGEITDWIKTTSPSNLAMGRQLVPQQELELERWIARRLAAMDRPIDLSEAPASVRSILEGFPSEEPMPAAAAPAQEPPIPPVRPMPPSPATTTQPAPTFEKRKPDLMGGFSSLGRGSRQGDEKDQAMRKASQGFIGELLPERRSDSSTGSSARHFNADEETADAGEEPVVASAWVDKKPKIVMLARNSEFRGQPLRLPTKRNILGVASQAQFQKFVVGDMPGVDSAFIDFLEEHDLPFTIYHAGSSSRIRSKPGFSVSPMDRIKDHPRFKEVDTMGQALMAKYQAGSPDHLRSLLYQNRRLELMPDGKLRAVPMPDLEEYVNLVDRLVEESNIPGRLGAYRFPLALEQMLKPLTDNERTKLDSWRERITKLSNDVEESYAAGDFVKAESLDSKLEDQYEALEGYLAQIAEDNELEYDADSGVEEQFANTWQEWKTNEPKRDWTEQDAADALYDAMQHSAWTDKVLPRGRISNAQLLAAAEDAYWARVARRRAKGQAFKALPRKIPKPVEHVALEPEELADLRHHYFAGRLSSSFFRLLPDNAAVDAWQDRFVADPRAAAEEAAKDPVVASIAPKVSQGADEVQEQVDLRLSWPKAKQGELFPGDAESGASVTAADQLVQDADFFLHGSQAFRTVILRDFAKRRLQYFKAQRKVHEWDQALGLTRQPYLRRIAGKERTDIERHAEHLKEAMGVLLDDHLAQRIPRGFARDEVSQQDQVTGETVDEVFEEWNGFVAAHADLNLPKAERAEGPMRWKVVTSQGKDLLAEVRAALNAERKELNRFIRRMTNQQWIDYRNDYLMHVWSFTPEQLQWFNRLPAEEQDKQIARAMRLSRTGKAEEAVPAHQRRIPTYTAGVILGMTPKTFDAFEHYRNYVDHAWRMAVHKHALSAGALMRMTQGSPLYLPVFKQNLASGDDRILDDRIVHEMAAQLATLLGERYNPEGDIRAEYNRLVEKWALTRESAGYENVPSIFQSSIVTFYVHPDAARALSLINDNGWQKPWARRLSEWTAWTKWMGLSLSLFHPASLVESMLSLSMATGVNFILHPRGMVHMLKDVSKQLKEGKLDGDRWQQDGLIFTVNPDVNVGLIDQRVADWIHRLEKDGNDRLASGLRRFIGFKKWWDNWLWFEMHPAMKVWAANFSLARMKREYEATGTKYSETALRRKVARFVNYAFGGLEFGEFPWMTPKIQQLLHWTLFAPDWTLSCLRESGLAGVPPLSLLFPGYTETEKRLLLGRTPKQFVDSYIPSAIVLTLVVVPNLMQFAIWAAAGSGDDDDVAFTWLNEAGRKTSVDMTPLLRWFKDIPFVGYEGGETGRRRVYLRWGKQAYEVYEGWLRKPFQTGLSKLSVPVRTALEQITGYNTAGWELGFHKAPGVMGGLFSGDGKVSEGRLAYVAKKFVPMSILSFLEGRPSTFIAPAGRGASDYVLTERMAMLLRAYADEGVTTHLQRRHELEERLDDLGWEILDVAERNGYDPQEIVTRAKAHVLGHYYNEFFKALERNSERRMEVLARSILRMHGKLEGLQRSMNKRAGAARMELTPQQLARLETSYRSAELDLRLVPEEEEGP